MPIGYNVNKGSPIKELPLPRVLSQCWGLSNAYLLILLHLTVLYECEIIDAST